MSTVTLDARNTFCPIPVIRAQDKIAELKPGDILIVTCTDHGALSDIPAWCRINGHDVLETTDNEIEVSIKIKVNETK